MPSICRDRGVATAPRAPKTAVPASREASRRRPLRPRDTQPYAVVALWPSFVTCFAFGPTVVTFAELASRGVYDKWVSWGATEDRVDPHMGITYHAIPSLFFLGVACYTIYLAGTLQFERHRRFASALGVPSLVMCVLSCFYLSHYLYIKLWDVNATAVVMIVKNAVETSGAAWCAISAIKRKEDPYRVENHCVWIIITLFFASGAAHLRAANAVFVLVFGDHVYPQLYDRAMKAGEIPDATTYTQYVSSSTTWFAIVVGAVVINISQWYLKLKGVRPLPAFFVWYQMVQGIIYAVPTLYIFGEPFSMAWRGQY